MPPRDKTGLFIDPSDYMAQSGMALRDTQLPSVPGAEQPGWFPGRNIIRPEEGGPTSDILGEGEGEHLFSGTPGFRKLVEKAQQTPDQLAKEERKIIEKAIELQIIPDIFAQAQEEDKAKKIGALDRFVQDQMEVFVPNAHKPYLDQYAASLSHFIGGMDDMLSRSAETKLGASELVQEHFIKLDIMPIPEDAESWGINKEGEIKRGKMSDVQRMSLNFLYGAVRLAPELTAAFIDNPYELMKGFATFVPETVALVGRAANIKLTVTGPEIGVYTSDQVEDAIEEIKQNPLGVLMAGMMTLGVGARTAKHLGRGKPDKYITQRTEAVEKQQVRVEQAEAEAAKVKTELEAIKKEKAVPAVEKPAVEPPKPVEVEPVERGKVKLPEMTKEEAKILEPAKAAKEPWEMTKREFERAWGEDTVDIPLLKGEKRAPPDMPFGINRNIYRGEKLVRLGIRETRERFVLKALSEGKPVPASVLKDYPDLAKKAPVEAQPVAKLEVVPEKQIGVGKKGEVIGKKEMLGEKPTELGFMGITPEAVKTLGESTAKSMRSVSAATSRMIQDVKTPPEIVKGVKAVKETLTEHDRFTRQAEATSTLLKRTVEKAVPKKDRQMLVAHAIEHKMKGPFWDRLTAPEKELARQLSREKTKLDQFVEENKVLELLPESEKIRHLSHFWIDSKTGKPFKAMYGKFTKALPQAKPRKIQDYATGMKATPDNPLGVGKGGIKPSTTNPGEMIGLGWQSVMRAYQTRQAIKNIYNIGADPKTSIKLTVKGEPRLIRMLERWDLLEKQGLTEGYTRYSHYALDKPIIFKDAGGNLTKIKGPVGVLNEIYPHLRAYMENPTYNAFDNLVSVSRSAKLGLSMFHAVSLAAQETALSLGKLVTGHPVAAARRIPFTAIPRGLKYRKEMGSVERLLYQEGLELHRHTEQMGGEKFFRGVGIPSKAGNVITAPVKLGRDFIFGVVQPGMKTAFAHDTFLEILPKYLKDVKNPSTKLDWTKAEVIEAFDAGKTIPKEALKAARQAVQMADGHFSGEHWQRSLLETNRFMAKAYFSPTARTAWSRGLLSPTWQREHLLVAKNVAKSFMPDKLISKMKLAEIHPAAKAEYRQYLYGAVAVIGAVDVWNLMTTKMMDGESKHLWENPEGKGFAVMAPWNEPDYTITTEDGKTKTIKGGAAYIRPLKSLFEVAEWVHHPIRKFSYKLNPYVSAIIAQMPNNKYRNYKGMKDIPERAMDFMFDVAEPISVTQLVDVAKGKKKWPSAVFPFFGMPTSKIKAPSKADVRRDIKKALKEGDFAEAHEKALQWNKAHPEDRLQMAPRR